MDWVKSALGILLVALAATYVRDAFPALRTAAASAARAWGPTGGVWLAAGARRARRAARGHPSSLQAVARDALLKGAGRGAGGRWAVLLRLSALNVGRWRAPAWCGTCATRGRGRSPSTVDAALARARGRAQPVMIDFFAEWCAACKELDRETYVAAEVVAEAERFVRIKVDGTDEDGCCDWARFYERFGVKGLPTVAFIRPEAATVLADPKVTGFLPPDQFLAELKKVRWSGQNTR